MADLDFLGLKQSIDALSGKLKAVRQQAEGLRREREELAAAPPTRADAVAAVHSYIDHEGARFRERILYPAWGLLTRPDRLGRVNPNILTAMPPDSTASPRSMELALFALLGPTFKDAVAQAIDAMPWPEGALPMAERQAQLAELDERIGKLEAEEAELLTHAAKAGVLLS